MSNKYELTNEAKVVRGLTLHRIKAIVDFSFVKKGDIGGWIETEKNLAQDGDAWVYGDAKVYGNAKVCDNAKVYDNAEVYDNARVYGNAEVCGNAKVRDNAEVYSNPRVYGNAEVCGDAEVCGYAGVYDNARVYGYARVCGNAKVRGNAEVYSNDDYIVFKNCWSSFRWFTYTSSNKKWVVGCFYGTGEELIKKAYADSKQSGKCYEAIVRAVEAIEAAKLEAKGKTK